MVQAAKVPDELHDWSSAGYVDEWLTSADRRQAERDQHFGLICQLLPFDKGEPFRFADLGAGGGALAKAVLDAFPDSSAVCVDGSPPMLERAKVALTAYGKRVDFIQADFGRRGWTTVVGDHHLSAVVSYQAIHNL